jgi:hypothetical protein
LTRALIFGKLVIVEIDEFPGFVPDSTAPVSGAFLFLGCDFLAERLIGRRPRLVAGSGILRQNL